MRPTKSPRPLSMKRVRRRLERWRRTRAHPRAPIPKSIWAGAVALARQHGLYQTARALPINYGALKQHLEAADGMGGASVRSGFVELTAFHGFCHFRDDHTHSISAAYRTHKRDCEHNPVPELTGAPRRWRLWSADWGWRERAALWDAEVDRQLRDKLISAQLEARQRHARLAQATLTVLSLPVKAALEAARDPSFMQNLIDSAKHGPAGTYALLAAIARMAHEVPNMVMMERLALGLTTESVEFEDKREFDVEFTNRILASSEATDLAIQLLHSVASGAGPPPALGSGTPREPRQVVADATPRPPDKETGGS